MEINIINFIEHIGYLGIMFVLLIETGILIGFFLPGDTLLLTIGILASSGSIDIYTAMVFATIGSIAGNMLGYHLGKIYGPKIFTREDSVFFKKDYIKKIEHFFSKFGIMSIILSRFVPIIRTGIPILAGVAKMNYKKFIIHTIIGGILWVVSLSIVGFILGGVIPNIDKYLTYIFAFIILITIFHLVKNIIKKPR